MNPVTETLLRWYDRNAREMPWRGIADPYGTWVSEIMLQQTRVETVRDYYPEFMARFPNVAALAEAPEEDVLKEWEGLGYYSRARNLHEGARQVMEEFGGVLPDSPDELRKIRGIGPYTSCSIASIAYNVPVPAVDGNVVRVICRLYDIHENPKEARVHAKIEGLAAELVPLVHRLGVIALSSRMERTGHTAHPVFVVLLLPHADKSRDIVITVNPISAQLLLRLVDQIRVDLLLQIGLLVEGLERVQNLLLGVDKVQNKGIRFAGTGTVQPGEGLYRLYVPEPFIHNHSVQQWLVKAGLILLRHNQDIVVVMEFRLGLALGNMATVRPDIQLRLGQIVPAI